MQTTMGVELIARHRYQNAILVHGGVNGEMIHCCNSSQ